ncbi:phage integrase family protein [Novosphingobium sp. PhB57]|uniref:tyrosine-type recombinase/integrase n=1 Tax=Novosphingobium sp. PhB57 TaxID=2485107 RepID=UPI00104A4D81|nr:tyrosine-type recombinase/integrase [Novosphingobium sp. PhB57]TCU62143.1 phage integrase family protein [Novosphingobium sp. PhB57]
MPESSEKERYIALDRRGAARQHRGEEQRRGKPPECPESGKNGGEPCWVRKRAKNILEIPNPLDFTRFYEPSCESFCETIKVKEELLAAAVRYVRERGPNKVFQYERRVPESVKRQPASYALHFDSKPLFRRSLRTSDQGEMHTACVAVHLEFERKVAAATGQASIIPTTAPTAAIVAPRKVTQTDLDELSDLYRRLVVEPLERAHVRADADPTYAEEYERLIYDIELHAEDENEAIHKRGVGNGQHETPAETAVWVVENRGWDAPIGSQEFGAVVGAIRSGTLRGRREAQALIMGEAAPQLLNGKSRQTKAAPTLRDTVEAYLLQRNLPARTAVEVKSSLRQFEELIGNKPLDALTRGDFQTYIIHLASQSIGGKTVGSITRPASPSTLRKKIGLLRAAINHAIDTDKFTGKNPASGIKVDRYAAPPNKAIMPEKRRFRVDEMNLIFQHPWFTGCASPSRSHQPGNYRLTGSEYWVPVVAAYTGCRASELGGVMLDEVRLDGHYPHFVIRDNKWRRTKKGEARNVPVLDGLLELGFASYVERVRKSGAERLFPDWEQPSGKGTDRNDDNQWSNGRVIRSFNRTVIRQMLGDRLSSEARQEVTFHGFRGAFKAMLGNSEYKLHPNIIHEIAGHEKGGMDAIYVGEIPIEETYPAVRGCHYKGLTIPKII